MSIPTYSIVIPVYNSSRSLKELTNRINTVFFEQIHDSFEIIFVDDYSPKLETWETLEEIARDNSSIRAFRLSKNFGQGGALICGMDKARGEWVITMDDDLQHCPEDIPLLLIHKKHDVVIGCFPEKKCGLLKKTASKIKSWLDMKLLDLPANLISTPFKLIKRRVVLDVLAISTPRPFMIALILAVTSDLVNVDVRHEARLYGKSNYTIRRSISLMSNMLFNNSSFLLRMMSIFGFTLACLSFTFGLFLIVKKLIYQTGLDGWTSLMVVILMSTGSIIFCLGVLGEYISRLIETSETRPVFLIKSKVDPVEKG